jgi:hypothetical protein
MHLEVVFLVRQSFASVCRLWSLVFAGDYGQFAGGCGAFCYLSFAMVSQWAAWRRFRARAENEVGWGSGGFESGNGGLGSGGAC